MSLMPYTGTEVKPISHQAVSLLNYLWRETRLLRCQRDPWGTYRRVRQRIAKFCHVRGGRCFGDAQLFDQMLALYRGRAGL